MKKLSIGTYKTDDYEENSYSFKIKLKTAVYKKITGIRLHLLGLTPNSSPLNLFIKIFTYLLQLFFNYTF